METADLGKHCLLIHKPGFPRWHRIILFKKKTVANIHSCKHSFSFLHCNSTTWYNTIRKYLLIDYCNLYLNNLVWIINLHRITKQFRIGGPAKRTFSGFCCFKCLFSLWNDTFTIKLLCFQILRNFLLGKRWQFYIFNARNFKGLSAIPKTVQIRIRSLVYRSPLIRT